MIEKTKKKISMKMKTLITLRISFYLYYKQPNKRRYIHTQINGIT